MTLSRLSSAPPMLQFGKVAPATPEQISDIQAKVRTQANRLMPSDIKDNIDLMTTKNTVIHTPTAQTTVGKIIEGLSDALDIYNFQKTMAITAFNRGKEEKHEMLSTRGYIVSTLMEDMVPTEDTAPHYIEEKNSQPKSRERVKANVGLLDLNTQVLQIVAGPYHNQMQ